MRKLALALAAAFAAVGPAQAATTLYANNFDAENGGATQLNYTGFSGLTVTNGTVDLVHTGDGFGITCVTGGCVDLDGSTGQGGTLKSGTFSFGANQTVRLLFSLGGNQRRDDGGDPYSFRLDTSPTNVAYYGGTFNGNSFTINTPVNGLISISTGGTSQFNDPFGTYGLFFRSLTAGTISFSIATTSSDNVGPLIDNVSLTAVPEPAQWALLIGGFAFAGAALRRRRPTAVIA